MIAMEKNQIQLVQASFAKVLPIADAAAAMFYKHLFELDPALKGLFRGDMREQGKKLMGMIATAVRGLDDIDRLIPAVGQLGARHLGYGVKDRDYETVATALLWTLEQGLGDAFTAEVKAAWVEVYGVLAHVMKQGASDAMPRAAA